MANIVLTRVDDRLIHGQVVSGWLRHTQGNRIVIVDEGVAKDEFMLGILEMAAPPGVPVNAYTVADAIEYLSADHGDSTRIIVLAKSPLVIVDLVKADVPIKHLNIGGMGSNPSRKKLYKNIQASGEEIAAMKELQDLGVEVEFRVVVENKAVALNDVLK